MGTAISRFSRNRHVVCFQEVHGNRADIFNSFTRWLPGWMIVQSACCDSHGVDTPASGGVVTAICPELCKLCTVEDRVIVPGRCLWITLCCNSFGLRKRVHVLNLHNYGFSGDQVTAVGAVLDDIVQGSASRPKEEFGVLIGDFNFMAGDDRVFQVGAPPVGLYF